MSSSKATRAVTPAPWAWDELPMPDVFEAVFDDLRSDSAADGDVHDAAGHGDNDTNADNAMLEREQQAQEERVYIESMAYARGRAECEAEMRQESQERIAMAIKAFASAVDSVRMHEARWTSNAEENIAALAVVVARHLVQREVTADATIVRDLVTRTLQQFPIDQTVSVRLHPDDVAACGTLLEPDSPIRARDVQWISDPTIQRGGCLTEGRDRIIDGRVDTSLERAYRAIGQVQA